MNYMLFDNAHTMQRPPFNPCIGCVLDIQWVWVVGVGVHFRCGGIPRYRALLARHRSRQSRTSCEVLVKQGEMEMVTFKDTDILSTALKGRGPSASEGGT